MIMSIIRRLLLWRSRSRAEYWERHQWDWDQHDYLR